MTKTDFKSRKSLILAVIVLMSLILVKPLAQTCFREITVPYEKDYLIPTTDLIRIYDNAFLNFLVLPGGTLAATVLRGDLKVIWK